MTFTAVAQDVKQTTAKAKTEADPYGMTNKKSKSKGEIQGSFPIRLRSGSG